MSVVQIRRKFDTDHQGRTIDVSLDFEDDESTDEPGQPVMPWTVSVRHLVTGPDGEIVWSDPDTHAYRCHSEAALGFEQSLGHLCVFKEHHEECVHSRV